MAIKVDTSAVATTAQDIYNKNKTIREDFVCVDAAIQRLGESWDGTASDRAMEAFRHIKNSYCDNRYNVVDNLVNYMKNQVGDSYEKTEASISSAAQAFK